MQSEQKGSSAAEPKQSEESQVRAQEVRREHQEKVHDPDWEKDAQEEGVSAVPEPEEKARQHDMAEKNQPDDSPRTGLPRTLQDDSEPMNTAKTREKATERRDAPEQERLLDKKEQGKLQKPLKPEAKQPNLKR